MDQREWQRYSLEFRDLLKLEYSPVAINCVTGEVDFQPGEKVRICRAILDAGKGRVITIGKENNACFGASWHLGFQKITDENIKNMIKKFVVEGEKLFCSYEALDRMLSQMSEVPNNAKKYFILSPMEKAESEPELIIFICDANSACRILTLLIFLDGIMPKIKIGGPTCRMIIMEPLITGEMNLSFYDYTARKMCNVEKDKLLIAVPYKKIPEVVKSIDCCSAGRAKIEFPPEFRKFLLSRLTGEEDNN